MSVAAHGHDAPSKDVNTGRPPLKGLGDAFVTFIAAGLVVWGAWTAWQGIKGVNSATVPSDGTLAAKASAFMGAALGEVEARSQADKGLNDRIALAPQICIEQQSKKTTVVDTGSLDAGEPPRKIPVFLLRTDLVCLNQLRGSKDPWVYFSAGAVDLEFKVVRCPIDELHQAPTPSPSDSFLRDLHKCGYVSNNRQVIQKQAAPPTQAPEAASSAASQGTVSPVAQPKMRVVPWRDPTAAEHAVLRRVEDFKPAYSTGDLQSSGVLVADIDAGDRRLLLVTVRGSGMCGSAGCSLWSAAIRGEQVTASDFSCMYLSDSRIGIGENRQDGTISIYPVGDDGMVAMVDKFTEDRGKMIECVLPVPKDSVFRAAAAGSNAPSNAYAGAWACENVMYVRYNTGKTDVRPSPLGRFPSMLRIAEDGKLTQRFSDNSGSNGELSSNKLRMFHSTAVAETFNVTLADQKLLAMSTTGKQLDDGIVADGLLCKRQTQ